MSSSPKSALRKTIHDQLNALSFHDLMNKSGNLRDIFEKNFYLPHQKKILQSFIVSFYPFSTEPQINLESYDLKLGYVRVMDWNGKTLEAAEARRDIPGQWEEISPQPDVQIFQPMMSQPKLHSQHIGAIMVPGLAFDRQGNRLGRGKGFYDKFLKEIPGALRIGLAFHEQILKQTADTFFKIDAWDEPVDVILTDQEWIETPRFGLWQNHGRVKR